ncbi:hypothetical protein [uncultured Lactobacillus sp.]|uniref:hypothetical protein n=1 Tax=uncultured Lactobacillus sp. TaxID=153152 RepID=UPI0028053887|nr:hypothetical protein [uncultured Lactobacillus sp.]
MNKKTFDLIIKIVLTILALASGVLAFTLNWPSHSTVGATIYGITYLIAAVSFWLADKKYWLRVVMLAALTVTIVFTISQALSGEPLGVNQGNGTLFSLLLVLLASPAVLGLIYFNLDANHSNMELLLVFMRIILSFEIGIISFMLIIILETNGALIWSLPLWGQYLFVYGILLLAVLDVVYAVINWLKFYRGKVTWITTGLMVIEIIACFPILGMQEISVIIFMLIAIAILIFTAYLNNYDRKELHKK